MKVCLVAGLIDDAESCLIFQVLNGLLGLIWSFDAIGELFEILLHLLILLLVESQVLVAPHLRPLVSVPLVLSTVRLVLQSQRRRKLILLVAGLHTRLSIIGGRPSAFGEGLLLVKRVFFEVLFRQSVRASVSPV